MKQPKDLRAWARLLKKTREFFDARDYLEVTTAHAVPCGAFEASIDVFDVPGLGQLHSSPEMEMKCLLSEHRKSIYQICRCFRNDPITDVHHPEFTMLEFYRVGASYADIMAEMKDYLEWVAEKKIRVDEYTYDELLDKNTGMRYAMSTEELRRQAQQSGLSLSPGDSHDDIIYKAWIQKVETNLGEGPLLVKDYPCEFGALAALNGVHAERFEIYWQGKEICNGCREEASADDVRARYGWESQNRSPKAPHPEPTRLLKALDAGLPDCAGVAVGLERLYFCLNPHG